MSVAGVYSYIMVGTGTSIELVLVARRYFNTHMSDRSAQTSVVNCTGTCTVGAVVLSRSLVRVRYHYFSSASIMF